jgi:hypothetical protein
MNGLDQRLADEGLLRLAGLRVRQRKTQPPPGSTFPDPPEAWWDELWSLVRESPSGLELMVGIGMPEEEVRAFLTGGEYGAI